MTRNTQNHVLEHYSAIFRHIQTASKGSIQETVGATGEIISNEIVDKVTSIASTKPKSLKIPKKGTYHLKKRQKIVDEPMLI